MTSRPLKVLYIAGWDRSGSTILSNILGEIPGFFSTGEINNLWQRGLIDNKLCGCERPFAECPLWGSVMNDAFGGMDKLDPAEFERLSTQLTNANLILSLLPGGQQQAQARCAVFLPVMERLYSSIQSVTQSKVIVDASKKPTHGYMLSQIPGIELHVVHLIRSPHGVAHSLMKTKRYDPDHSHPSYMARHGALQSTLIWSAWNLLIERLWKKSGRYIRIRYEDFMAQPITTVKDILHFMGEATTFLPFVDEQTVMLGMNHNVSGNPSRFNRGRVSLKLDNEWESTMKIQQKLLIDFLYFPVLWRYGYLPTGSLRQTTQTIPN